MSTLRSQHLLSTVLLSCALALSACSTPSVAPLHTAHSTSNVWNGRLGLQVQDPLAPEQSLSVSFHLQGSAEQGSLQIFNPLGSQVAQLDWQPGAAVLQQGQRLQQSSSLDALLQQSLGAVPPVPVLFAWLQGQQPSVEGWSVDLSRYASGRITAQRTFPTPVATLRIVLQQPE